MSNKMIEFFIESGAEITGSSVGALIGGFVAGPGGAMAGVVGGKAVEKAFSKLGAEIQSKVLSERENKKIGATATYSLEKIKENIEKGKCLRDDDFFEEDISGRSKADEIMEGIMFSAQREHEEKKLKFYGNLVSNIAFDKSISRDQANQLILMSKKLSYRQLKLLSLFGKNEKMVDCNIRMKDYSDESEEYGYDVISVMQDIFDLCNIGIAYRKDGTAIISKEYVLPGEMLLDGMGKIIYELMELSGVDDEEIQDLIKTLN